jgi:hypothetical protein
VAAAVSFGSRKFKPTAASPPPILRSATRRVWPVAKARATSSIKAIHDSPLPSRRDHSTKSAVVDPVERPVHPLIVAGALGGSTGFPTSQPSAQRSPGPVLGFPGSLRATNPAIVLRECSSSRMTEQHRQREGLMG